MRGRLFSGRVQRTLSILVTSVLLATLADFASALPVSSARLDPVLPSLAPPGAGSASDYFE